jgi:hypothetical protein
VYPEDRVLVGVINRKRDLDKAQYEHWYRVPQGQAPKGIHAEYVALFLSRAFGKLNGGIHYYARRTGIELARRRDLLPEEPHHPHVDHWYHKLQFEELLLKDPPVLNPTRRSVGFIYTTWDRFVQARKLADLYSDADAYVDRVFHALQQSGIRSDRIWEAEHVSEDGGAQLWVVCQDGIVIASTAPSQEQVIALPVTDTSEALRSSVETILEAIRQYGGPLMINLPIEE